eukprot:TRINITY_DN206_c0_g1_i2.p2 TRINITY_DN206_c0_g1~~TRINITY_DN206_c0_g1_i2.p2  ORF type:complete len:119 (-),score=15.95 TRINITY_DN206_c0_g1_i2:213-569(-)
MTDKLRTSKPITREVTINLRRATHKIQFKKRAPRAIKEIRKLAKKIMGTNDVRLDVKLNKAVWEKGVKNVPTRLRIVISRRRNDDEEAKEDMYSYVTVADVQEFKGKGAVILDDADES